MHPVVLPQEELKRRIAALRKLRGMSQVELGALVEEEGWGKLDVGRIERGDVPMTPGRLDAIARHLGVAREWLTEPDLDVLLGHPGAPSQEAIERIDSTLRQLMRNSGEKLQATSERVDAIYDLNSRVLNELAERQQLIIRLLGGGDGGEAQDVAQPEDPQFPDLRRTDDSDERADEG
jgi:transcriptional regulator with XRE-family HTH domain